MSEYKLNPEESFHENIIRVFKMKMEYEKIKFDYINPNLMGEILEKLENYYQVEEEDNKEIWKWIQDMYGA